MRVRSGLMLTLAVAISLGGCAAGGGGGVATGPGGVRPRETDATRRAQVLLLQDNYTQALALLEPGLAAADSANPRYQYLAGEAYAGLGRFEDANRAFGTAERLYPAYSSEIVPVREEAWGAKFNEGISAYQAGNVDAAIAAWEQANVIFPQRPEAFQNLAAIYTQRSEYDDAIAAYQGGIRALTDSIPGREITADARAARDSAQAEMRQNLGEILIFTERYADAERVYREQLTADPNNVAAQSQLAAAVAAQPGREAEGQQMYSRLLALPNLSTDQYQEIGTALFNAKNYAGAVQAFARVSAARPNSRDAWYNHANALYAVEQWGPLLPIAEKLVQLDPLTQDSWFILARAQREARQNAQALRSLEVAEAAPFIIKELRSTTNPGRLTVRGSIEGNAAPQGSPVQLRFTFYGPNNETLGTQMVAVTAPARGAAGTFTVTLDNAAPITGYKYEVVR